MPNRVNGRLGVRRPTDTVSSLKKRALVPEERVRLAVEVHDQQIEIAVVVDVDGVDAHARLRDAVLVERAAHRERRLAKAAAALIQPQVIRRAVVRHEDVDPAVAIEVAGDDAEAVADGGRMPARSETSVNVPSPLL